MSDSTGPAAPPAQGHLNCPACQAIDKADGSEDGRLYRVVGRRVKNERAVVERFKRGQDRAADGITAFAGSLNFVYLFLSTFVMVSQNRQSARADIRSEIDFENNLRGEIWAVHIGHALSINPDHVEAMVQQAMVGYRQDTGLGSVIAEAGASPLN